MMNGFAHGYRFLHANPYFLVGTAIPDWLTLVDRKVRVRKKTVSGFTQAQPEVTQQFARGILQHLEDDQWFHNRRQFVELNLRFAIELRDLLGHDGGFRPHLVGHIVIEMLLDAYLYEQDRQQLDNYYAIMGQADPGQVESMLNEMATTQTNKIALFMPRFIDEGYLYDYIDDQKIQYRMNRILQRVKLTPLPAEFLAWLPSARNAVYENAQAMLAPPATA